MEAKKRKLIKLVMELGSFIANCDGEYDVRESEFIDKYINEMSKQEIPLDDLLQIKRSLCTSIDIDYLVDETKKMLEAVEYEEKKPLLKTLSYFINGVIEADGVIHPNETKYYMEWKQRLGLDDDIDISEYLA